MLPRRAAAQEAAVDAVILTVVGAPGRPHALLFDRDDLERMRVVSFATSTIWTEGLIAFRGVPLHDFLGALGISTGRVKLYASNDYAAEIPVAEIAADVPILAFEMDGQPMARRDKGPIWVVYPYDSSASYQNEVTYTRSIWQLERIEALP